MVVGMADGNEMKPNGDAQAPTPEPAQTQQNQPPPALRRLFLRLPFSAELEKGTRRLPAVGQIRRRDPPGTRPFEVGQQCAARIVCDCGD